MCTALLKHAYAILLNAGAAHRFAESEVTIHYRSPIRNLQQSGQQQVGIHLTFWRTLLNCKLNTRAHLWLRCRRTLTRKN